MFNEDQYIALYFASKPKYPGAILLVEKQEAYTAYGPDAKIISAILDIEIFNGQASQPSIDIPSQFLDTELAKLLRQGHQVAIVERPNIRI